MDELCAHQVCGILIHLPWEVDLRDLQDVCRNVPIVAVDSDFGFECPSVFVNQELGSRKATRHLLQLGHKKIAHLRGPVPWRAARLRYVGWQKELKAARLPAGPVVDGDWTAESGFEAAQRLISNHWGKFTAVVVANDQMALGAIRAFEESSIRYSAKDFAGRLRRHSGSRLFPPASIDHQTGFCRSWPAKYPMFDGPGRSEPGNFIESHDSAVFYRARKHRSTCQREGSFSGTGRNQGLGPGMGIPERNQGLGPGMGIPERNQG